MIGRNSTSSRGLPRSSKVRSFCDSVGDAARSAIAAEPHCFPNWDNSCGADAPPLAATASTTGRSSANRIDVLERRRLVEDLVGGEAGLGRHGESPVGEQDDTKSLEIFQFCPIAPLPVGGFLELSVRLIGIPGETTALLVEHAEFSRRAVAA
jgi:hypothetical protein